MIAFKVESDFFEANGLRARPQGPGTMHWGVCKYRDESPERPYASRRIRKDLFLGRKSLTAHRALMVLARTAFIL